MQSAARREDTKQKKISRASTAEAQNNAAAVFQFSLAQIWQGHSAESYMIGASVHITISSLFTTRAEILFINIVKYNWVLDLKRTGSQTVYHKRFWETV